MTFYKRAVFVVTRIRQSENYWVAHLLTDELMLTQNIKLHFAIRNLSSDETPQIFGVNQSLSTSRGATLYSVLLAWLGVSPVIATL